MAIAKIDTIGRVEKISFPKLGLLNVPAKVDTGAKTSSIWASNINLDEQGYLSFCLFGRGNPRYDGKKIIVKNFQETIVISSMGISEHRFKVKLSVNVHGRLIRASFTLSNRSRQLYPILIGRNILRGKFIVNVKIGQPLRLKEKEYSKQLQASLKSKLQKD
jgi:hypothetical protein